MTVTNLKTLIDLMSSYFAACRDDSGRTALHWAAALGLYDIAKMLLQAPAGPIELQLEGLAGEGLADDIGDLKPDPLVELQV